MAPVRIFAALNALPATRGTRKEFVAKQGTATRELARLGQESEYDGTRLGRAAANSGGACTMKMIAEYLEHAGRFEQKAEEATDRKFKEGMLRQAAAYRKLAERRAEILNVPILAGVCTTISLLSALFAAALWFMSAEVTIPAPGHFPIIVHPPDPLTAVPGDTLVGVGNSPKLQEWTAAVAEAFGQQSKLSGSAAVATSVAIFFEVFAILFRAARLPRLLRLASRMWIAR